MTHTLRLNSNSIQPMPNPEATFDVLRMVRNLDGALGGVAQGEVHLFAYLSCLLILYRGRPVSDWGYTFVNTEWGTPFSRDIAQALDELAGFGLLLKADVLYRINEEGAELCAGLSTLDQNAERIPFLDAACASALAISAGTIREALQVEPSLSMARTRGRADMLLSGPATHLLYDQFADLSAVIGVQVSDLLVPSVVWLTYLAHVAAKEEWGDTLDSDQLAQIEGPNA
jgi:hypothetical protein